MGFFPIEDVPKAVVARVSTVNARNEPNCTPVWPVFDGKKVYFATDPGTQKLKNLRRNPGIAVTFDDYDKKDWSKTFGIVQRIRPDLRKRRRVQLRVQAPYGQVS